MSAHSRQSSDGWDGAAPSESGYTSPYTDDGDDVACNSGAPHPWSLLLGAPEWPALERLCDGAAAPADGQLAAGCLAPAAGPGAALAVGPAAGLAAGADVRCSVARFLAALPLGARRADAEVEAAVGSALTATLLSREDLKRQLAAWCASLAPHSGPCTGSPACRQFPWTQAPKVPSAHTQEVAVPLCSRPQCTCGVDGVASSVGAGHACRPMHQCLSPTTCAAHAARHRSTSNSACRCAPGRTRRHSCAAWPSASSTSWPLCRPARARPRAAGRTAHRRPGGHAAPARRAATLCSRTRAPRIRPECLLPRWRPGCPALTKEGHS